MFDEINAFDIYKEPPFSFLNYFTFTTIGREEKVYNLKEDLFVSFDSLSTSEFKFTLKCYNGYDRLIDFINKNKVIIGVCFSNSFNSKIIISCYKDKFKDISFSIKDKREIEITIPICEYKYDILSNEDDIIYLSKSCYNV